MIPSIPLTWSLTIPVITLVIYYGDAPWDGPGDSDEESLTDGEEGEIKGDRLHLEKDARGKLAVAEFM